MTTFEDRLARLRLGWVWNTDAYMTVHKGFGFVIYYKAGGMWLCVLSPCVVSKQLEIHGTKAPYLTGFWNTHTERMFELPVSNEFLTHVIGTAHPEMFEVSRDES
jgi:hypothetical protein